MHEPNLRGCDFLQFATKLALENRAIVPDGTKCTRGTFVDICFYRYFFKEKVFDCVPRFVREGDSVVEGRLITSRPNMRRGIRYTLIRCKIAFELKLFKPNIHQSV